MPQQTLTGPPLRLLLVEDNLDDADLVLTELMLAGYDVDYQRLDDEAGFLAQLNPNLDIILSDYSLPQFSASRTLALLRESGYAVPCIVVTGTVGEEAAVACMRQGAADYLLKDRLSRLGTAVAQALEGAPARVPRPARGYRRVVQRRDHRDDGRGPYHDLESRRRVAVRVPGR